LLAPKIIDLAEKHLLAEIEPPEIDSVVLRGRPLMRLNLLEARYVAKMLNELKPETAYVDAPDTSPERFACQILQCIDVPLRIISEHHADKLYPIVSAASILAKVRRDEIVGELHKVYGDFGSGYPSDSRTIKFVKQWILSKRCDLPIVRRTWTTFRNLERELL
jgi:ribonuclease HII